MNNFTNIQLNINLDLTLEEFLRLLRLLDLDNLDLQSLVGEKITI